jgi:hypothetical protein
LLLCLAVKTHTIDKGGAVDDGVDAVTVQACVALHADGRLEAEARSLACCVDYVIDTPRFGATFICFYFVSKNDIYTACFTHALLPLDTSQHTHRTAFRTFKTLHLGSRRPLECGTLRQE